MQFAGKGAAGARLSQRAGRQPVSIPAGLYMPCDIHEGSHAQGVCGRTPGGSGLAAAMRYVFSRSAWRPVISSLGRADRLSYILKEGIRRSSNVWLHV